MRIRSIKPEFWRDEISGLMEPEVALFFVGLWCASDDEGRFEWNPVLVRADLDPYDAKWGGLPGISKMLEALRTLRRIRRYEVDGKAYGFIPSFLRHQKPNRASESRYPPPPLNTDSVDSGNVHGLFSERSLLEIGVVEEKEKVAPSSASADSAPALIPSPVVTQVPVSGSGPQQFEVTEAMVAKWQKAYPAVDVAAEVLRAAQWSEDNPRKRKTFAGAKSFLGRWMAREQNKSRSLPPSEHEPRRFLNP